MRARIDVSEIEAKTKIRAKYLRALENEEWGLLPGPTFVKSFLRTYAEALGLDGKALVEEYRVSHEGLTEAALEPIVSSPQHSRSPGGGRVPTGPSRGYLVVVGVVGLLIILLVVGLLTGGGGGSSKQTASTASAPTRHRTGHHSSAPASAPASARSTTLTLSLRPSAAVYVCLIGDNGRKLIPGSELQPGESTPTFHAKRFEITLGNSSLTMVIDGRSRTVPPSSQAIGYSITKATGRRALAAGQLPTCK